jgi:hypothetical protein
MGLLLLRLDTFIFSALVGLDSWALIMTGSARVSSQYFSFASCQFWIRDFPKDVQATLNLDKVSGFRHRKSIETPNVIRSSFQYPAYFGPEWRVLWVPCDCRKFSPLSSSVLDSIVTG